MLLFLHALCFLFEWFCRNLDPGFHPDFILKRLVFIFKFSFIHGIPHLDGVSHCKLLLKFFLFITLRLFLKWIPLHILADTLAEADFLKPIVQVFDFLELYLLFPGLNVFICYSHLFYLVQNSNLVILLVPDRIHWLSFRRWLDTVAQDFIKFSYVPFYLSLGLLQLGKRLAIIF